MLITAAFSCRLCTLLCAPINFTHVSPITLHSNYMSLPLESEILEGILLISVCLVPITVPVTRQTLKNIWWLSKWMRYTIWAILHTKKNNSPTYSRQITKITKISYKVPYTVQEYALAYICVYAVCFFIYLFSTSENIIHTLLFNWLCVHSSLTCTSPSNGTLSSASLFSRVEGYSIL